MSSDSWVWNDRARPSLSWWKTAECCYVRSRYWQRVYSEQDILDLRPVISLPPGLGVANQHPSLNSQ